MPKNEAIALDADNQEEWLAEALICLQAIETLTTELANTTEAGKPNDTDEASAAISQWGQLVMRRGEAIGQLMATMTPSRLQALNLHQKQAMSLCLDAIQEMDQMVQGRFTDTFTSVDKQLKSLSKGKKLLQRYHLPVEQPGSTRSDLG